MAEQYYTVKEVATILRVHVETVRRWCEEGKLVGAKKYGDRWRIPRSSVDAPPPDDQERKSRK